MHLLGSDYQSELLEFIHPDQLPVEYGGTNSFDGHLSRHVSLPFLSLRLASKRRRLPPMLHGLRGCRGAPAGEDSTNTGESAQGPGDAACPETEHLGHRGASALGDLQEEHESRHKGDVKLILISVDGVDLEMRLVCITPYILYPFISFYRS